MLIGVISKTFSKYLFQTVPSKEQWSAPSAEHPVHSLLAVKVTKNEFLKQINLTANGIMSKTFEK